MPHKDGALAAAWSLLRTPIPPRRRGYLEFGWLILALFGVQIVTGILLSMYYSPSARTAAASVQMIMRDVDSGWLVRGIHHWCTSAIIALGLLHLLRIFAVGSYRGVGATSWILALLLMGLALAQAFSGMLLPWDNEAYWFVTRALQSIESVPLAGPRFAALLRGGTEVSGYTLTRAHAIHVLILPWLSTLLVAMHLLLLVRRRPERSA